MVLLINTGLLLVSFTRASVAEIFIDKTFSRLFNFCGFISYRRVTRQPILLFGNTILLLTSIASPRLLITFDFLGKDLAFDKALIGFLYKLLFVSGQKLNVQSKKSNKTIFDRSYGDWLVVICVVFCCYVSVQSSNDK